MVVQDTFKELVKDTIAPIFKKEGFKKSGNYFYKKINEELGWCFHIQLDQKGNTKVDLEFTFNVSIFVPLVYQALGNDLPKFPKVEQGVYERRITELRNVKGGYWYRLNNEYIDIIKLKELIISHITTYIFLYFHDLSDVKSVIQALENQTRFENRHHLAAMHTYYGDRNKGKQLLFNIYEEKDWDAAKEYTLSVCERLNVDLFS
ncbi:DUF4304 domain-containing protein [Bacillus taeanensis]|uniref:DUF4304 domain-containing protein n=1 Tax=Bacillus taeanensis TaxID=273032 RepID=A0A366XTZ5_9BACI|nr:DUF4304 domain-containing protein [Bacillus taeanensis]RBW69612.1 hypothetical protein DS031_10305 [Bacillus taeanensis]